MPMDWDTLLCDQRYRWIVTGKVPTRNPEELRTEFEKDYDRAVFSTPVRRLQDKAQVFPLEPCDAVRTRLTHSLEVSTVARDMARAVARWLVYERKEKITGAVPSKDPVRDIETIAATCGLLHDLGNPPFGHFGESAIQDWFAAQKDDIFEGCEGGKGGELAQDFLKFEGNAQTLRLVSKLQVLADEYGLNLTCGTLSALCKYTASAMQADKKSPNHDWSKPGYFASERDLIETVRKATGTGDVRNPITFLVEACDDLVYRTVDLEDGVKKGAVDWPTAEKMLRDHGGGKADNILKGTYEQVSKVAGSVDTRQFGEIAVQALRVHTIGAVVPAVIRAFKERYTEIMEGKFRGDLTDVCDHKEVLDALGDTVKKHVHTTPDILRLELSGRKVIHDLMTLFWDGAKKGEEGTKSYEQKAFSLISSNYRQAYKHALEKKLGRQT
ncbi:deoxyguanosinetriphosphate triphosphohydrolase : dGTPase OS=Chthoniobacter flavus Ellin428 GN=CfE428DRAFT_3120 PE=4 SV=1: HD [Gemmata massiliana]|uniref:HD/PDEase domain-containing protein n=1 Tax=Gemmata massiliana TaxID=1210884 RepID=A0A6P2CRE4_9BACT|nr:dNTP triphosphohydrolase [Gemmata massiliana]VTR91551.1 deoxyguanosinetriphosphate triphosphohydrolase : dGTPase OS=Chthoniobacter flavus Ellin428 GN=CfE428DRAFT_3120 PE=4 SV=1: HD [Gemmata massiliana]